MTRLVTTSTRPTDHAGRMAEARARGHAMGHFFQPLAKWFAASLFVRRGASYPHTRGLDLWERGPLMLRAGRIEPMAPETGGAA